MNAPHRTLNGRVGERSSGLGDISPALVEARAEEIAVSDGRRAEEATEADYRQAERELLASVPTERQTPEPPRAVRLPEQAMATPGVQAPNPYRDEDGQIGAELVEEGVQEAVHDDFVEGGKKTLADGAE
ncbi:MAG: hypothetical protein PW734_02110 [Verrucomicrobium sp.]|nr:hypothetical protein [Verrucomicrobium sp.]